VTDAAAPFQWPVRVYWEDTDAGGIVFYANYLKFFERARTEWLRSLGLQQQALRDETGGMFVVTDTQTRHHRPARLDDLLLVTTRLVELGRASMTLEQVAWLGEGPDAQRLCEGQIRIGWVDAAAMKPMRIPATLIEKLHTA
jgi:acyl-CoA thioester hydrolase